MLVFITNFQIYRSLINWKVFISHLQVPSEPFKTATTIPRVVHPFESTAIDVPDPPRLSSPPINKEENTSLIRKTKDEIMEESVKLILFARN